MFEIEPDEKVVASQNLEQICKNRIFDEDDFSSPSLSNIFGQDPVLWKICGVIYVKIEFVLSDWFKMVTWLKTANENP